MNNIPIYLINFIMSYSHTHSIVLMTYFDIFGIFAFIKKSVFKILCPYSDVAYNLDRYNQYARARSKTITILL